MSRLEVGQRTREIMLIKPHRKKGREERNKLSTKQLENNQQNGKSKSLLINNQFECRWTKISNQKTNGRMIKFFRE